MRDLCVVVARSSETCAHDGFVRADWHCLYITSLRRVMLRPSWCRANDGATAAAGLVVGLVVSSAESTYRVSAVVCLSSSSSIYITGVYCAQLVAREFPLLGDTARETALALNQGYVAVETDPILSDGDEVALIPPISGG